MKIKSLPLLGLVAVMSIGGLTATWEYADLDAQNKQANLLLNMGTFIYQEDMPDQEVSAVQRLGNILNKVYTVPGNTEYANSLDYLLNNTITKYWGNNIDEPYAGSMDSQRQTQINALFGDIMDQIDPDDNLSFILKKQDLNGDGKDEIAMYSTSDLLDNTTGNYDGVVCVYVSVFTPITNADGTVSYHLLGDPHRGYCDEIRYSTEDPTPSFSTDEWRDDVGYTYNNRDYAIPDTAMNADGTKPYKEDYYAYNQTYTYVEKNWWGQEREYTQDTTPYGQTLSQVLADDFANLNK